MIYIHKISDQHQRIKADAQRHGQTQRRQADTVFPGQFRKHIVKLKDEQKPCRAQQKQHQYGTAHRKESLFGRLPGRTVASCFFHLRNSFFLRKVDPVDPTGREPCGGTGKQHKNQQLMCNAVVKENTSQQQHRPLKPGGKQIVNNRQHSEKNNKLQRSKQHQIDPLFDIPAAMIGQLLCRFSLSGMHAIGHNMAAQPLAACSLPVNTGRTENGCARRFFVWCLEQVCFF
ncbi:MAG: hypothetical protein HDT27_11115 [Subdoligranulum sp.]|nr:hypothetical protein [Subdoligranulum sp.]